MNTITIGKTSYTTTRDDIFEHHAKCTGKHKRVKSKGAEKRDYPFYSAGDSTANYVRAYEALNVKRKIMAWDWLQLRADPCLAPVGIDSYEEVDHASDI